MEKAIPLLTIIQCDTVTVVIVTAFMHQFPHPAVLSIVHDRNLFMDSNTSFHTKKYPSTIQYIFRANCGGQLEKFTKNSHLKHMNTPYRTKFPLYIRSFSPQKLPSVFSYLQKIRRRFSCNGFYGLGWYSNLYPTPATLLI